MTDPWSQIAKLVPMLSSEHAGEVAAAAAGIERKLKAAGLTWHDLAARISAHRPQRPPIDPATGTWEQPEPEPEPEPDPRQHDFDWSDAGSYDFGWGHDGRKRPKDPEPEPEPAPVDPLDAKRRGRDYEVHDECIDLLKFLRDTMDGPGFKFRYPSERPYVEDVLGKALRGRRLTAGQRGTLRQIAERYGWKVAA